MERDEGSVEEKEVEVTEDGKEGEGGTTTDKEASNDARDGKDNDVRDNKEVPTTTTTTTTANPKRSGSTFYPYPCPNVTTTPSTEWTPYGHLPCKCWDRLAPGCLPRQRGYEIIEYSGGERKEEQGVGFVLAISMAAAAAVAAARAA